MAQQIMRESGCVFVLIVVVGSCCDKSDYTGKYTTGMYLFYFLFLGSNKLVTP